jgi:sterol desaturase/sphingolipid hydroxylase (fatty acid hydroxylase superfamily)
MPPVVSLTISAALWRLFLDVFGAQGSLLFLGFATGYVIYDCLHYAFHQLPVRNRLLRRLKRHHTYHHSSKHDGNFAVSGIFWDSVFRTRIDSVSRRGQPRV